MDYQQIKVITELRFKDKLDELAAKPIALESWRDIDKEKKRIRYTILALPENNQTVIDRISAICGVTSDTHLLVMPISAVVSKELKQVPEKSEGKRLPKAVEITREQLYNIVAAGTKLDINYIWLVILSTLVAAIGLLENHITIIIGAMVIAPLLGPNLAMALGTTLGDWDLMKQSIRANLVGIVLCVAVSFIIGLIWPYGFHSAQILLRTDIGYDGMVLALASGAAAVLSITSGLSTILVGVMVSAALLPPLAVVGMLLGSGDWRGGLAALVVVVVNIVSINLIANLTFVCKGIRPSRWYERQKAKKAIRRNIIFWAILLLLLAVLIYVRHGLGFVEVLPK